jgi:hypothetical protein
MLKTYVLVFGARIVRLAPSPVTPAATVQPAAPVHSVEEQQVEPPAKKNKCAPGAL